MSIEVVPATMPYYERMTTEDAVQIARETIEEWDWHDDPHGYCHSRSVLARLVWAITGDERDAIPAAPVEGEDQ